jgi:hypothetical protein
VSEAVVTKFPARTRLLPSVKVNASSKIREMQAPDTMLVEVIEVIVVVPVT